MNENTNTPTTFGGIDINMRVPLYSALNLALGLSIPVIVAVLMILFYQKIK